MQVFAVFCRTFQQWLNKIVRLRLRAGVSMRMKFQPYLKQYTLMMIRGPKQSVLRVRVPAFLLLAVPLFFAAVCLFAYLFYFRSVSSDQSNRQLQTLLAMQQTNHLNEVTDKDQAIEQLQKELLRLSEQAEQLDARMEDIRKLEEEMKRLTGLGGNAASPSLTGQTGVGGRSRDVTDEDVDKLIADTDTHYQTINSEMDSLFDALSKTKESVLEQQHQLDVTPTIWPVDSRSITSPFGMRRDPFSYTLVYHSGIDIGAPSGEAVYAGASGTVSSTGFDSTHGNNIIVNHGNGLKTWYMHLSKIETAKGDPVKKGQVIGRVGSTGRSTGPHLHYEVLKDNTSIDPKPYLKGDRKEE